MPKIELEQYYSLSDEEHQTIRRLALEWDCSEYEVINFICKSGKNPQRPDENEDAYFERLAQIPDVPAFLSDGTETVH
jgi:hypothetical protein